MPLQISYDQSCQNMVGHVTPLSPTTHRGAYGLNSRAALLWTLPKDEREEQVAYVTKERFVSSLSFHFMRAKKN